jgi:predicted acylesterase/phospholipase RssA
MFDKVVFAGGGHRCWWQAGFWEQVTGEIELHPRVIGGVSAGAVTACLLYANDSKRALAWYERELAGVRSNINWFNLVRRGQPLMPHAAIYRKALRALLGGEHFRQLMWRAPEIRVQFSRLPPGMSPGRAVLKGLVAYNFEKYWHGSLHPTFGQRLGFTYEVKRVQDCRGERELVDLLVASSSTPPFTPVELIDGEPCLDGGLVDNVPIGTVADVPGHTLVLTTRRYKKFAPVFVRDGRMYVQPSERVAASSWDYTSPAKYQKTYDLGRRDGDQFLKAFALGQYRQAGLHAVRVAAGELAAAGPEAGSGAVDDGADVPADGAGGPGSGSHDTAAAPVVENGAVNAPRAHAPAVAPAEKPEVPAEKPEVRTPVDGKTKIRNARRADRADDSTGGALDVSAKLAAYRDPTDAGIADDLSASQPAASDGQDRSGRSLRASNI